MSSCSVLHTGGLGKKLPPLHGGPKKRSRKDRKSGGSMRSRNSRGKHTRRH